MTKKKGETMLRGEELTLTYHDGQNIVYAIHNVTIAVEKNQFVGIMGPSGSGKSSLLYLLSGLRLPTQGHVYFEGRCYDEMRESERVALRRQRFGFVFQQHFLINYLTVLENVLAAVPRHYGATGVKQAMALLENVGLGHLVHRFPYQLSGGERQRVAVARALANEPSVIFADEPTGQLDHSTGHQIMDLLISYREKGSLIVATHDPEMLAGADRIIHLRDGKIVAET